MATPIVRPHRAARRSSPAPRAGSGGRWRRGWPRPAPPLVLNGSDAGRLAEAAAALRAAGHTVHEAAFDVTDEAAVVAAFGGSTRTGVAVDILVNNAGHPVPQADGRARRRRIGAG